jgi:hypothetical protein
MKELRRTLLTERLTEVAISPPQVCKKTPLLSRLAVNMEALKKFPLARL